MQQTLSALKLYSCTRPHAPTILHHAKNPFFGGFICFHLIFCSKYQNQTIFWLIVYTVLFGFDLFLSSDLSEQFFIFLTK